MYFMQEVILAVKHQDIELQVTRLQFFFWNHFACDPACPLSVNIFSN